LAKAVEGAADHSLPGIGALAGSANSQHRHDGHQLHIRISTQSARKPCHSWRKLLKARRIILYLALVPFQISAQTAPAYRPLAAHPEPPRMVSTAHGLNIHMYREKTVYFKNKLQCYNITFKIISYLTDRSLFDE
jgi:hypothetical protein